MHFRHEELSIFIRFFVIISLNLFGCCRHKRYNFNVFYTSGLSYWNNISELFHHIPQIFPDLRFYENSEKFKCETI